MLSAAAPVYLCPLTDPLPRRLQSMRLDLWQSVRLLAACFLLTLCATSILAQTHVVSQADIHKELVNTAQTRQKNLEKTRRLFSSDETRKAMESAQIKFPTAVTYVGGQRTLSMCCHCLPPVGLVVR